MELLPPQGCTLGLVWVVDDVRCGGRAVLLGRSRWPIEGSSVAQTSICRHYSSIVIDDFLIDNAARGGR